MHMQYDLEQLQAMHRHWRALLEQLEAFIREMEDCSGEATCSDLPDIIGLLSDVQQSRSMLIRLHDKIERVCDYLFRCIQLMSSTEGPSGPAEAAPSGHRSCRFCGQRMSKYSDYCPRCGWRSPHPIEDLSFDDDFTTHNRSTLETSSIIGDRTIPSGTSLNRHSAVEDDWDDLPSSFDSDIDAAPQPSRIDDDDWGDWSPHGSSFDAPPPRFDDDISIGSRASRYEDAELSSGETAESETPSMDISDWELPEPTGDPWEEGVGLAVREGNLPPRLSERHRSLLDEADDAFREPEPPKKKKFPNPFRRDDDFVLASPAIDPIASAKRYEHSLGDTICLCPRCGSSAPAIMTFCPYCGSPLHDAAPKREPKPAPRPSQVQFTAVAPKQFNRGEYALVDIFMYEEKWRHVVDQYMRSMDEPAQEKSSGFRDVAADAMVRIVLTSKDVEIDDNEESARWTGKYLQFSFAVSVPEDFDKKQIQLKATVYVNDVPLTHLIWNLKRKAWRSQVADAVRRDVNSIFMSYSSHDRSTVATIIKGIQLVRPDIDIFFDVDSLYSGEKWKKRLQQEIDNRDMFFLCWSRSARESQYVDFEWRYALQRKGIDCIQPVPLERPSLCPPPPELDELHFNDKLLYIINAN